MSDYNTEPIGIIEISLEKWHHLFSCYNILPRETRQVRIPNEHRYYDLSMFDVPNFDNHKMGVAIAYDWHDPETQRNREKPLIKFCRYGTEEQWESFNTRFAAQFAGDNS